MNIKEAIIFGLTKYIKKMNIKDENIHVDDMGNHIEIIGEVDPNDNNNILKIIVLFLNESRQIHIPIISIPESLKHVGHGKFMIKIIYQLGLVDNYDVFIVDMVDSFYNRMIRRGAIPVDHDSVQIINTTNLEPIS